MDNTILNSVKKIVGIAPGDTSFDEDLIIFTNGVLNSLTQIGVGPEEGFTIDDASETWEDFIGTDKRLAMVKEYVGLKVKQIFDPGSNSLKESMTNRLDELEFRISIQVDSRE